MSSLRFAAIFTFAVQAFPRGVVIFVVISDTKYLVITILRPFFDFTMISGHEHSGMLGGHWEWTAYMGLLSLPLILIGIVCAKFKEKWFYCPQFFSLSLPARRISANFSGPSSLH